MAGDWLKFEKSTLDKPEVFEIASALDIDPDAVIGKLLRVWDWFDDQSANGCAPVTVRALLDRYSGVTGFTLAMENVGWIRIDGDIMTLPNFGRHNGQTAKVRALSAKRMAKSRNKSDAESDGLCVTKTQPEKKRKEKSIKKEAIASCPKSDEWESLWNLSPKESRERSSKRQVKTEWGKIKVSDRPEIKTALEALEAWKVSEKWKDGFSEGLHLWVKNRQWENIPTTTEEPVEPTGTRRVEIGGRVGHVIKFEEGMDLTNLFDHS